MSGSSKPEAGREYVLGTNPEELSRLQLQNRLWSDAAHAAWRRAGIKPGINVLDIGAGPGFASFDLAQIVRMQGTPWARGHGGGRVVAVDESAYYIDHLNQNARQRGLDHLEGHVADVHDLQACAPVRDASFDLAYIRWVLCFVRDPAAVLRSAARALKPGGRMVIHDYFNYETMTTAPRTESFRKAVEATARSWRDRGGNPDVLEHAGALVRQAGCEITHLDVHLRVARPGDSMWAWPDLWWHVYVPVLVKGGYLTAADQAQFEREWGALCGDPNSFVVCPPVFEVIATRSAR